ncbi:MAG: 50S ribosomal protein L21 [Pseudomonadota bacterium]|nr:50S ribosomal protein L21 [Pseudomonadota bacterium]
MFAVIKTGGLQYRVIEDQVLKVGKIRGEPGEIVQLGEVMMLGGDTPQLGAPMVSGASVAVEVIQQGRGKKVIAFKKRRRKNSRRRRGHRQEFTLIRISEILTEGKAPSKKARPKPEPKAKVEKLAADTPGAEGEEGAAKPKAQAKSAKKPKPAAKKPASKPKSGGKAKSKK